MTNRVVVVGAGHAAGQFAARLRNEKFEGEIVMLGNEPQLPYQRPPLSKAYLAGEVGSDRVLLRPADFYEDKNVEVRLSTAVAAIDTGASTVTTQAVTTQAVATGAGDTLEYTHLVLATGARVRRLPGFELAGVHYVRTLADSDSLKSALAPGQKIIVVGGGYIGLEVAAVAAKRGAAVTVLEAQPRILSRVATAPVADYLRRVHEANGVVIRTGVRIARAEGEAGVGAVVLQDDAGAQGERIEADAVIVGIGITPNTELAEAAGLHVDDGIVVDERGATTCANVWAIGDCSRHPSRIYGRSVRLESVHNAMAQAGVVAANIAGKDTVYNEIPWFWSDQYDLKLQIAGLADGHDETVIRGDPDTGSFTVFALARGCVIAADSINAMRDHIECRKLAAAKKAVDKARLADVGVALKEL
ncbi:MAG: NAD(P)-binding protein [Gammaproteobacteria bacterium]|nr:NAD(P)-binding protein [Gammaproteobacteria bacterium]